MPAKNKQNKLPKCVVCGHDTCRKLNKDEVACSTCGSQYPLITLMKSKKAKK